MKKMALFLSSLFVSTSCFSVGDQRIEDLFNSLRESSVLLFKTICQAKMCAAEPLNKFATDEIAIVQMNLLSCQVKTAHLCLKSLKNADNQAIITLDKATKEFNDVLFQLFGESDSSSAKYKALNHMIDLALEDQKDAKNLVLSAFNSEDLDKIIAEYNRTDMIYAIAERITQQDINDLTWRKAFYTQAWTDIKSSPQEQHDFLWFLVDDVKKWCKMGKEVCGLLNTLEESFNCQITEIQIKDEYKPALGELLLTIASEILKDRPSNKTGKDMLKKSRELGNGTAWDYIQHEYPDLS